MYYNPAWEELSSTVAAFGIALQWSLEVYIVVEEHRRVAKAAQAGEGGERDVVHWGGTSS